MSGWMSLDVFHWLRAGALEAMVAYCAAVGAMTFSSSRFCSGVRLCSDISAYVCAAHSSRAESERRGAERLLYRWNAEQLAPEFVRYTLGPGWVC